MLFGSGFGSPGKELDSYPHRKLRKATNAQATLPYFVVAKAVSPRSEPAVA